MIVKFRLTCSKSTRRLTEMLLSTIMFWIRKKMMFSIVQQTEYVFTGG